MRHRESALPYTDDFARWAEREAGDPELAERIALFSPFDFPSLDDFRAHLIATIEDHIESSPPARVVARSPFRFLRGHLIAIPLDVRADDLTSFRAGVASVDESSIYFHTVEAPGARHGRRSDFAEWVEAELGMPELAQRISTVDPFVTGLTRARQQLLATVGDGTPAG